MMKTLLTVLWLGALAGCIPRDNALRGQLRDEKSKWLALAIHNYSYDYERQCFCGDAGTYRITVRNDAITTVVNKGTGQSVATSATDFWYTIPELYDYLIEATRRADDIFVHFDLAAHLPETVSIDFIKNAIDDELALVVSNFVNAPSPQGLSTSRPATLPIR